MQVTYEGKEATTNHVEDSDIVDEERARTIEAEAETNEVRNGKDYDDGNGTSAISRSSSIASIAESVFSMISGSSMSSVTGSQGASERFVALLLSDDIIKPLCNEALATVATERFERNLRRLLKELAVELRKEAETVQQRDAAHFVRYRARNSAHMICNSLNQKRHARKPIQVELDYISEDSDSGSSDDEVNDLQQLEAFIRTSKAIQLFRERLRDFIYPGDAKDNTDTLSKGVIHAGKADNKIEEATAISPLEALYERIRHTLIFLVCFILLNTGLQAPPVATGKTRLRWQCISFESWYITTPC